MWAILRLMMIGSTPGNRELSVLRALLRRTPVLPVYSGQRLRQPVYVVDRAGAVLAAAECTAQIDANYNEVCPKLITFTANSRARVRPVARSPDAALSRCR